MRKNLNEPDIFSIDGITVVDDSKVGTKIRIAWAITQNFLNREFFYATTPDGAGAAAFAEVCHQAGRKLTLISSLSPFEGLSPSLLKAQSLGAKVEIIPVSSDQFHIVQAEAKSRAKKAKGLYVDFDNDIAIRIVADEAKKLNLNPGQVWSASARGAMARAYQIAWPNAEHYSIVIVPDVPEANFGKAKCIALKDVWAKVAGSEPIFACNSYYEARAWPGVRMLANRDKNPLFWNPAGPN